MHGHGKRLKDKMGASRGLWSAAGSHMPIFGFGCPAAVVGLPDPQPLDPDDGHRVHGEQQRRIVGQAGLRQ